MLWSPALAVDDGPADGLLWLVKGFGVSGLNPTVFLLFLALLPQFTDPSGSWPLAAQMVALGLIHTLSCAVVYLLVAHGARVILAARPRVARVVSRVSGAAMVVIAGYLIVDQLT
ncbi:MAG TPA: LysE family transporter [Trueperaceae bacterium]|nr:LysE family transporter [Trueperaceae bacterium]